MELWCGWDDLHSLEGPASAAADVPDSGVSTDGAYLHKVPASLDGLGVAGGSGCLG